MQEVWNRMYFQTDREQCLNCQLHLCPFGQEIIAEREKARVQWAIILSDIRMMSV